MNIRTNTSFIHWTIPVFLGMVLAIFSVRMNMSIAYELGVVSSTTAGLGMLILVGLTDSTKFICLPLLRSSLQYRDPLTALAWFVVLLTCIGISLFSGSTFFARLFEDGETKRKLESTIYNATRERVESFKIEIAHYKEMGYDKIDVGDSKADIDEWWNGEYLGIPKRNIMYDNCSPKYSSHGYYRSIAKELCSELKNLNASLQKKERLISKVNRYEELQDEYRLVLQELAEIENVNSNNFTHVGFKNAANVLQFFGFDIGANQVKSVIIWTLNLLVEFLPILLIYSGLALRGIKTKLCVTPTSSSQELALVNDRVEGYPILVHPLNILVGKTKNGQQVIANLGKFPHLLVAGLTGGGKSSFIKTIMAWIVEHADPKVVKILPIDMKEGATFFKFDGVPHLIKPVATSPEQVVEHLNWISEERSKRQAFLTSKRCEDVNEFIETYGGLPFCFIILFIEEVAEIATLGKDEMKKIAKLNRLARGVGIHLVLATQYPKAEVLPTEITSQCGGRLCFRMSNAQQSRVVLDRTGAENLSDGHAIFSYGGNVTEIKVNYTQNESIKKIVHLAKKKHGIFAELSPATGATPSNDVKLQLLQPTSNPDLQPVAVAVQPLQPAATHCGGGRLHGVEKPTATPKIELGEVIAMLQRGDSICQIERNTGINKGTISRLKKRAEEKNLL